MSEDAAETAETDVAVVGAGPVGLFQVFECGMLGMRCNVFDTLEAAGGQCQALYPEKPIYDIPGLPEVNGAGLVENLLRQAEPFQPTYHLGAAVTALGGTVEDGFEVETAAGVRVRAKAVVIAGGVGAFGPNRPPLEGIEFYECQGPGLGVKYLVGSIEEFRGRRVVIAGGGDSAVDWALALADVAAAVKVVHRRPKFRAQAGNVDRLMTLADAGEGIELVVPYQLSAVEGEGGSLRAVVVADLDGGERRLEADALLPFFGLRQSLGPIAEWGLNLERNRILIDPTTAETSRAGVFAVGDIADYPNKLKLILSGFSEAAFAAHKAFHYVFPDQELHFEYSTTKGLPGG